MSKSPRASDKNSQVPENLSMHFSSNGVSGKNPSQQSLKSPKSSQATSPKASPSPPPAPPPKNVTAAEAMRKKRDAERREMKKMIAEKRNEKVQILHLQQDCSDTDSHSSKKTVTPSVPVSPKGELHILDDDKGEEEGVSSALKQEKTSTSPSKGVKFQDFLGRDYTPVTSEEDAAVLDLHQQEQQLQQMQQMRGQPALKRSVEVEEVIGKPALLTSTDDFELNKRTEAVHLNQNKQEMEGKVLVSSSCGDLLLSLKKQETPQDKDKDEDKNRNKNLIQVATNTVVESHVDPDRNKDDDDASKRRTEDVTGTDTLEATNPVYEQLDPDVYEQLAEEMGEGWGDYTPDRLDVFGNKLEDGFHGRGGVEEEVSERDQEKKEERVAEHAAEEFNNMLSVMQDALNNIPVSQKDSGVDDDEDDDDSTFEEEEHDVEDNRILGTFGPDGDALEEVVGGLKILGEEDEEGDDEDSLGSSWGEVEEEEESNYEMVNHDHSHDHHQHHGQDSEEGKGEGDNDYDEDEDEDKEEDIPPPDFVNEHDMTVYGVPFPLDTEQRGGMDDRLMNEDSAACRMEYIREFLEDALGEDQFVQAYRLLKAVDIVDEDLLLEQMENIVGTDGLKHMGVFIQLITIEEKFENL